MQRTRNQALLEYEVDAGRYGSPGEEYVSQEDEQPRLSANPRYMGTRAYQISASKISPYDKLVAASEAVIEASRYILQLANDFDEDDFQGYSEDTWKEATNFLRRLVVHAASSNFFTLIMPALSGASQGSIDLFWEMEDRTLLLNFPSGASSKATFYGQKPGFELSGRIEKDKPVPELIIWLEQHS